MNVNRIRQQQIEIEKLSIENTNLKRQLQKAAEINHKMWLALQDQVIHTEQLERISGIYAEKYISD